MKTLIATMMALPLMTGVAGAAQPLSDSQMDGLTAGFSAQSIADAEGLVGPGFVITTTTATLAQITPYASAVVGETFVTVFKSVSAATSSSVSSPVPTLSLFAPAG